MRRHCLLLLIPLFGLLTDISAQKKNKKNQTPEPPKVDTVKKEKPPASINDKVKSSRKIDGMFTLYQDTATGSIQLYVKKDQLGKEYIYQSFSINGPTQLYLNQSMHRATFVFKLQKVFDKMEFARVNTSFWYDKENPVSKTAMVDKPDAVFITEKVVAEDAGGYLVSADGLFISDKLDPIKPVIPPGPNSQFNF